MDRIAEIEQKAANGYWETDGDESVFSNTPMLEDIRYLLARVKAADALWKRIDDATNMRLNQFYHTDAWRVQKMSHEQWLAFEIDAALAAYQEAVQDGE